MGANLYFVSGGSANAMSEHQYETEGELQKLIADNPDLLLRDSDPDGARLMLVAREFEMPVCEDSSLTFWLDHLLVDQGGCPVLVETKRCANKEIRREVVGQMLDYASRVSSWDVGSLREYFQKNNAESDLLDEYDTDEFWEQVATHLKAERFRIVFAADRIPDTLKTMIEFLDRNLNGIEVYGVELRMYKADNAVLLSSNIIGNTMEQRKSISAVKRVNRTWTLGECLEAIKERGMEDIVPVIEDIWNFAVNDLKLICKFRHGKRPAFLGWMGRWVLFEVTPWWKKQIGQICTLDFYLPNHVRHLAGTEWDEKKLRELFTDLPGSDVAREKGLLWETPKCVYFELRLMKDPDFFASFKQMLKKIQNITEDAFNSQDSQDLDAYKSFSTFDRSQD